LDNSIPHPIQRLMKKILFLYFLLSAFLLQGQNQSADSERSLLIRLQPKINVTHFFQKYTNNSRNGLTIKIQRKVSTIFNIYKVQSNNNDRFIQLLKQDKSVLKVGYDQPAKYRNIEPNDESFNEQWNMLNIQADKVWEETTGGQTTDGKRIVIGVLEKGIDPTHEDLRENIWRNEAEIPNNGRDDDSNGYIDDYFGLNLLDLTDEHTPTFRNGQRNAHGTQVAGVIGAKGDNEIGITGINWDIDLLLFSKVSFASEVLEAQEYAYHLRKKFNETNGAEGAFIVALNYSFGWDGDYKDFTLGTEMCEMIELMGQAGILSVVSTDNKDIDVDEVGDVLPSCPSDFVIAVTSSDERNEKTSGSGFGSETIDLAAPGNRIYTLDLENDYGFESGTSLAAPLVSGTVGLLYSLPCTRLGEDAITNPGTTAKFMKAVILNGTQPLTGSNARTVSEGKLDAFAAMEGIQLYCGRPQSTNFQILSLFPNPVTDNLTLVFETPDFEPYQLFITNTLGQIVRQKQMLPSRFEDNVLTEEVSGFASGLYFLTLVKGNTAITEHFIVEN